MRVYVPATLPAVRAWAAAREVDAPGACAVTPALREWYAAGDGEELEYAATIAAARHALDRLAADPAAPRRRVVLALDVPDTALGAADGAGGPADVALTGPRRWREVASILVDDAGAVPVIAAAVEALPAAGTDPDAAFVVESAEGEELQWYAAAEVDSLLEPGPD